MLRQIYTFDQQWSFAAISAANISSRASNKKYFSFCVHTRGKKRRNKNHWEHHENITHRPRPLTQAARFVCAIDEIDVNLLSPTENVLSSFSMSYHVVVIKTIKYISTYVVFFITVPWQVGVTDGDDQLWPWAGTKKNLIRKITRWLSLQNYYFSREKSLQERAHIFWHWEILNFKSNQIVRLSSILSRLSKENEKYVHTVKLRWGGRRRGSSKERILRIVVGVAEILLTLTKHRQRWEGWEGKFRVLYVLMGSNILC